MNETFSTGSYHPSRRGRSAKGARFGIVCGVAALLSLAVGYATPARATVALFDTTGGGGTTASSQPLLGTVPLGDSFLVGLTGWDLTGVTIDVGLTGAPTGGFNVYLDSNTVSGSTPAPNSLNSTVIGSVLDSSIATTGITAISLATNQVLTASTRYWIVLAYSGRGATSSAAWIYQNALVSSGLDNASSEYSATTGVTVDNLTVFPYQMMLAGTVNNSGGNSIPEPPALWLLGAALVLVALSRTGIGHREV